MWARARRGSSARPAALRRVRRLKLLTALLLMVLLTLGLGLFSAVIAAADAGFERDRVDELLRRQVRAGRGLVEPDGAGGYDVGALAATGGLADGYPQLYVVGRDGRVLLGPDTPYWPDAEADVVALAVEALDRGDGPRARLGRAERVEPVSRSERVRIMAWPLPGPRDPGAPGSLDRPGAAVVGIAGLASGEASHERLVTLMWWSAGAVLLLGAFLAVALARGRFWLVDRALDRHEQFLHDTAHELRSPIATLRTIVSDGLDGDGPPHEALEQAMRVIQGTDVVIDDLMTLTRIETGRVPLAAEQVRLDLLVEALASRRSDDPPVVVRASPTVVWANAELVRRAVGNLIENAVRHGRVEDPTADVLVVVRDGRVTVSDRGPGVAPQLLPHVLERITTGRHRRTGSGLGLAIAGWVARIHGGELTVTNRSGRGASFTLVLPR